MSNNQLIFKQAKWWVVLDDLSLLLFISAGIWMNIHSFFFYKFADVVTARLFSLAFLFIFCPLLLLCRIF